MAYVGRVRYEGTDENTLSTTSYIYTPTNFQPKPHFIRLLIIDHETVRSSFVLYRCLTKLCDAFRDGDCSAGRLYRCVWRACSRRPHTHATCERRFDAKASSDDAVVDVEVDRISMKMQLQTMGE